MSGEGFELGEFTQRGGPGRAGELMEEFDDLRDGARHPGRQRVVRIAAEIEQPRGLVTQAQNIFHHLGIVPATGIRSFVRRTRRPGFVEGAPQGGGFRVGDYGHIRRLIEREDPALDTFLVSAFAGLLDEHLIQATQLVAIGDVIGPAVGGVEDVLLELRLQLGELQHHRLEALFALHGQADSGEPEIAQRMLDHLFLDWSERRALFCGDRAIGPVERFALCEIRLVGGEQRQAGVVACAQCIGIQYPRSDGSPATMRGRPGVAALPRAR